MSRNPLLSEQLAALESGLRVARRTIWRRRLLLGFSRGISAATLLLVLWAAAVAAFVLVGLARGTRPEIGRWLWNPAIFGAVGLIVWHVSRCVWRRIGWADVAERVDLAMSNHNRIATAHDFAVQAQDTPFIQAAIADGIHAMAQAHGNPVLDPVRWPWQSISRRLVVAAALLLVVAAAMRANLESPSSSPADAVLVATLPPNANEGGAQKDNPRAPPRVTYQPPRNDARANSMALAGNPLPARQARAQQTPSAGGAGGNATGSSEADAGVGTAADSKQPKETSPTPPKPQRGKPSLGSGMGGGVQGVSIGGVGSGSKGGGGKSLAVDTDSRRQDAAELESSDDIGGDPPPPDDSNDSRHRGGAQPLLQDRAQSPTRELGLGGLKGMPGTGRGGPTPTKKARGAGSLLLGVPVPDFVPGKLLAGMSKIARENIRPRRTDAPLPAPAPGAPYRSVPENALQRFDVAQEEASTVIRYLLDLHRDDATPVSPGAAGDNAIHTEESRSP